MARTTMHSLISQLRELTAASHEEFSNDRLEEILDSNKVEYTNIALSAVPTYVNNGILYRVYPLPEYVGSYFEDIVEDVPNLYFYLTDSVYTPQTFGDGENQAVFDPHLKRIVFNADTQGKMYYLTAVSYDLYGAGAEVWTIKCSNRTGLVDIKTDNHTIAMSQERDAVCNDRINYFSSKSFKYADTRIKRTDQGLNYDYSNLHRLRNSIY